MEHVWRRDPGERTMHAFVAGPGWMRSLCGALRWTTRLVHGDALTQQDVRPCAECVEALDARHPAEPVMVEGEAAEAFGR